MQPYPASGGIDARHQGEWQSLTARWQGVLSACRQDAAAVGAEVAALFPDWESHGGDDWQPPSTTPPAVRFGSFAVRTAEVVEQPTVAPR